MQVFEPLCKAARALVWTALVAPACSGLAQAQGALDAVLARHQIAIAVPTDSAPYGFVGTDL